MIIEKTKDGDIRCIPVNDGDQIMIQKFFLCAYGKCYKNVKIYGENNDFICNYQAEDEMTIIRNEDSSIKELIF